MGWWKGGMGNGGDFMVGEGRGGAEGLAPRFDAFHLRSQSLLVHASMM